ncbi:hypothetical protein GCM10010390_27790 [Streptomyces mordarskii]|uniref:Uncharacterized protein n=1 Tax=Streptomyces mordarskii TaxID=1226758 RepID=A0ABN1CQL2_9ACTN
MAAGVSLGLRPRGAGGGQALVGGHGDQVAFELGEQGQLPEEHLAEGVIEVDHHPGVDDDEADFAFGKGIGDLVQVAVGTAEPVELGDGELVPSAGHLERGAQFGAVGVLASGFVH